MKTKQSVHNIIKELSEHAQCIDARELEQFADEIVAANNIYLGGAGRSGLAIKAFAMRLMHLGLRVHMLGDVTTPHTAPGDLLIIGSGSGETKSLLAAANKAKASGMRVALNTIDASSAIAKLADAVIVLPGASQKVQSEAEKVKSIQPMGSSFEQLSLLVYDALIMTLMEKLSQSNDEMFTRHADIE